MALKRKYHEEPGGRSQGKQKEKQTRQGRKGNGAWGARSGSTSLNIATSHYLLFLFFLTPVACFPSPALQYLY